MRRWRVGSMSMGLALILLGVLLFISQVSDRPAIELFTIWWPVILIILGLEILAHPLLLRKQEPVLKYDFVSIVFAGLIGMVGIACTVVTASGLFRELEFAVAAESRTFDLPAAVQPVDGAIKRIVLNPGTHRINLEASTEDDVRIFGTYRATVARGDEPPIRSAADYVQFQTAGDTLYIRLKDPANKSGPFSTYTRMETTLLLPADVRLEVIGNGNWIHVAAHRLREHWIVHQAGLVVAQIGGQDNLTVTATAQMPLQQDVWDTVVPPDPDLQAPFDGLYRGSLKIGEGAYRLEIVNSEAVSVSGYQRDEPADAAPDAGTRDGAA